MNRYRLPLLATLLATAVTAIMDFNGYFNYSAFPLFAIILLFWLIQRQTKEEFGLMWGKGKFYGIALLYPTVVLGVSTLIAYIAGDFSISGVEWWPKKIGNIAIGSLVGPLILLLTEEGFFRGWLWGAFRKGGMNKTKTLFITSGLFVVWHISAVTSGTEFGLPYSQIPVYIVNGFLLGLIWGLLRTISGSVLVASLSHAVWNAFAYELFGFGEKTGALGVTNTFLFGPEVGLLGIVLNGLFFLWLWKKFSSGKA